MQVFGREGSKSILRSRANSSVPVSPPLRVSRRIHPTVNMLPHQKRKGIHVTRKAGAFLGKNPRMSKVEGWVEN